MGRGAYSTTGVAKPKPPPKRRDYDDTTKQQKRYEEMNRRDRTDRELGTNTPRSDHQVKEAKDKKLKEEHRRMQWDLDQKNQNKATAAGSSTVAPKEPKAAKPNSRRSLAKVLEVVTTPWTRHKEGEVKSRNKQEKKHNKNEKNHEKKQNMNNHQKKKKNGKKLEKKKNRSRELKP